ncbi:hypothetical protein E2C01_094722 [Portunus trituberculatus]|uniref:Uncharacterized protein n=1 Tax=Portunus trituberculatus TaxID=210409 RepID=A0A5B7JYE1_PORTR|nr:hypothetical protein [Portunus trituberculatus]
MRRATQLMFGRASCSRPPPPQVSPSLTVPSTPTFGTQQVREGDGNAGESAVTSPPRLPFMFVMLCELAWLMCLVFRWLARRVVD